MPYRHSEIVDKLLEILKPGDVAMVMGAGDDVADLAKKLFSALKEKK